MLTLAHASFDALRLNKLNLNRKTDSLLDNLCNFICEIFKLSDFIGEESLFNLNSNLKCIEIVYTVNNKQIVRSPISSNAASIWLGNTLTPLIISMSSVLPVNLAILAVVLPH